MAGQPEERRVRLEIAYDGTNYSGWQRQRHDVTIQGEIERCLAVMAREDISLHGAGRTDAGVHAQGMVAHFDCKSRIRDNEFMRGLNSMLPKAIRILNASTCSPDFHSRFSSIGKKYQYHIYTGSVQPPHMRLYSHHVTGTLDMNTIGACLKSTTGMHDFASFENSGSRDKNFTGGRGAVRTIYTAQYMVPSKNQLIFEFTGDGFLKNMVRNLVGTILEAGRGKISTDEYREIVEAKDRSTGGPTAPAHGLFLMEVFY